jgi:hypothetical protein
MKELTDNLKTIIGNLTTQILELITFNYTNYKNTFDIWLNDGADYDFKYIYEMNFKKFLLPFFTVESERILSYYSQNFYYAFCSFYEITKDFNYINHFTGLFINKQFEYIDHDQLFLENLH